MVNLPALLIGVLALLFWIVPPVWHAVDAGAKKTGHAIVHVLKKATGHDDPTPAPLRNTP
jgi:hypothetical protein